MTTVVAQITTGTDDGSYFSNSSFVMYPMVQSGTPSATGFLRFAGLAIPAASTVTAATLTLVSQLTATTPFPTTTIVGAAADNPAAPTSYSDLSARVRTSASVSWTPSAWTSGASYASGDLSTVVQEIVDRPGWVSGNALMLFWQPPATGQTLYANGYEQGSGIPTLTIDYASAPTGVTGTTSQTLPLLTQSAAVTVTVPTSTGTVAQTLPAVTQTATAVGPFVPNATVDGTDVVLTWEAKSGSGYAVERDGSIVAFGLTDETYTDTPGEGEHTYRVGVLA